MSKVASFQGVNIVVRTRDEHCEPHVHAYHTGQGWEMRLYFSYVSGQSIELELIYGRVPSQTVVQRIMDKVIDNLDKARELFWDAVQTVCLENKHITVVNGIAHPAQPGDAGAILVKKASYLRASKSIEYQTPGSTRPLIARCP
jgi:hypothetical protein